MQEQFKFGQYPHSLWLRVSNEGYFFLGLFSTIANVGHDSTAILLCKNSQVDLVLLTQQFKSVSSEQ